jgi:hypothetical protein
VIGKSRFGVEHAQQLVFMDDKKGEWCHGCCRAHPDRLPRPTSFAEEVRRAKHGDDGFLPGNIYNGKFHAALLDVHDRFRSITLESDGFPSAIFDNLSRQTRCRERLQGLRVLSLGFLFSLIVFLFESKSPHREIRALAPTVTPQDDLSGGCIKVNSVFRAQPSGWDAG